MKITCAANQKGGTGKSAVAVNLAHYLARCAQRTLAIDADHQGNMSQPLRASGKAAVANFTSSQVFKRPWAELVAEGATIPDGDLVLIPADDDLMLLERQGTAAHNLFATNFRNFLATVGESFAAGVIDTNPNPDVRLISSLISSDYVLSPIQLNQEAINGIGSLLAHPRVGVQRIRATLNPKLELLGLLPNLVEPTPFQKQNFLDIVAKHRKLLIPTGDPARPFAYVPKRSAIAEAQASGEVLWEMSKSAARDTWRELEPVLAAIVGRMKIEPQQAKA